MSTFNGFGVSNEQRNLTITGRNTVPLAIVGNTPVQQKGSIILDPSTLKLYYSDGASWVELSTGGGGSTTITPVNSDVQITEFPPGTFNVGVGQYGGIPNNSLNITLGTGNNSNGPETVALGYFAGNSSQSVNCVAVGHFAGG